MVAEYKVWGQVERIDVDEDEWDNIGDPDELACFDTEEEAKAFLSRLEARLNSPDAQASTDTEIEDKADIEAKAVCDQCQAEAELENRKLRECLKSLRDIVENQEWDSDLREVILTELSRGESPWLKL